MKLKLTLGAALLLAALIFGVQNASVVVVRLLVWQFSLSLSLVIFSAVAAGLIGGWAITSAVRRKRRGAASSPSA